MKIPKAQKRCKKWHGNEEQMNISFYHMLQSCGVQAGSYPETEGDCCCREDMSRRQSRRKKAARKKEKENEETEMKKEKKKVKV